MIRKTLRYLFVILGAILLLMIILALTPAPFYMHYHLGDDPNETEMPFYPKYIVMLGGAGMPSESNLIRLYFTAQFANHYETPVVLVHPKDSICQAEMTKALTCQGIEHDRILYMTDGSNTRSQVLELREQFPDLISTPILVVTSPENMRRTIKCFNKVGFSAVRGASAREATVDFDLSLKKQKLDGNETIPNVESTNMRYTFWNYFKLETTCFREYCALAYYRIKGWI